MFKNVAGQKWRVFAFDTTDGTAKTGDAANITGKVAIDHAAAGAITDTNPTEVEDGYYLFDLTQAETNGDVLDIYPESSTANIQVVGVPGTIYTQPQYFPDLGIESDGDLTKVNTLNGHTAQTGDSFARLGAPAGASIAADLVTIDNFVDDLEGRLTAARAGYLDNLNIGENVAGTSEISGLNDPTAAAIADAVLDEALSGHIGAGSLGKAVADIETDTNELQTNQGNWATATTVDLNADQSGVTIGTVTSNTDMRGTDNAATAANLATVDNNVDAILVDTGTTLPGTLSDIETDTQNIQSRLPAALVGGRIDATIDGTGMESAAIDAILQRQITEEYNTDGAAPTVEQALMLIMQALTEFSITSTTLTVKKLDGSTTAATFTLNDDTSPTSITRAS